MEKIREDPRVSRSRQAVLEAAVDVLAEHGYGAFTIDAVFRRSGVARSTIYRLWGDRASLIGDALDMLNRQPGTRTDSAADARHAVVTLLRHLDSALNVGPVAACLPALIDGAERDPEIRRMHHRQSRRRRKALVEALSAALPDRSPPDVDLLADALSGAFFYLRLMTPRRLTRGQVERLVDLVLD